MTEPKPAGILHAADIEASAETFSHPWNPKSEIKGARISGLAGLSRTGVTAFVGDRLIGSARGSALRLLVLSMVATAVLSAFISNAGTVATLMPAVVVAAWGLKSSPAAFLIPLAFAANAGGLLTLTGSDSPFVFIWTEDLAAILTRAATDGPTGIYNVAGDGALGLPDLARMLGKPV